MLVTHHPMIFKALKKINDQSFIGRRVIRLIREDIAYYAMHTNYDVMGMADLAQQRAGSLPYGAQRRLEIVRALATNPAIILLDEPAAGMNPSETAELMEHIRLIRDTFQIAIMLIEHDMNLVMGVCEGIAVVNYGKIIAKGTPDQIRSNPEVIEAYLGKKGAERHAEG